jgi:hypothetical protein
MSESAEAFALSEGRAARKALTAALKALEPPTLPPPALLVKMRPLAARAACRTYTRWYMTNVDQGVMLDCECQLAGRPSYEKFKVVSRWAQRTRPDICRDFDRAALFALAVTMTVVYAREPWRCHQLEPRPRPPATVNSRARRRARAHRTRGPPDGDDGGSDGAGGAGPRAGGGAG